MAFYMIKRQFLRIFYIRRKKVSDFFVHVMSISFYKYNVHVNTVSNYA